MIARHIAEDEAEARADAAAHIHASDNSVKARYLARGVLGEPENLAIVAVMRTVITTLNAMVSDNRPWKSRYGT